MESAAGNGMVNVGKDTEDKYSSQHFIADLRKVVDNRFAKWIVGKKISQKKFESILAALAGEKSKEGLVGRLETSFIKGALERGVEALGYGDFDDVKRYLQLPYIRKGVALTLRSVAKYGLKDPQVFDGPMNVVWNITKQCNLNCEHCYENAGPFRRPEELSLDEKLMAVDQFDQMGLPILSFSGGEPLMDRDFWTVARYAYDRGMYTTIASNGTLLGKPSMVKRLKDTGVKYVEISLDSPDPAIHNKFRGKDWAWELTIQGIKNVVADGSFDVGLATTVTKLNLDQTDQMIDLAEELGVGKLLFFNFVPTGRGKGIIDLDLSPQEREEFLKKIYRRWQSEKKLDIFSTSPTYSRIGAEMILGGMGDKFAPTHFANVDAGGKGLDIAKFIGGCGAGRLYMALDDSGDVFPCVFLPIKAGNIRESSMAEIWRTMISSQEWAPLTDRTKLQGACKTCAFRDMCGGCRARAYGYFGDISMPDVGCPLNESYYALLKQPVPVPTPQVQ